MLLFLLGLCSSLACLISLARGGALMLYLLRQEWAAMHWLCKKSKNGSGSGLPRGLNLFWYIFHEVFLLQQRFVTQERSPSCWPCRIFCTASIERFIWSCQYDLPLPTLFCKGFCYAFCYPSANIISPDQQSQSGTAQRKQNQQRAHAVMEPWKPLETAKSVCLLWLRS